MTSVVTPDLAAPTTGARASAAYPTFLGVLRGELFKLSRQRLNWWMALGLLVLTLGPYIGLPLYNGASNSNHQFILTSLQHPPQFFLWMLMGLTLDLQRAIIGIFLLIATARMVGLDFQQGTIRVLLARGVGRLHLLGAKLLAMAMVGLGLFACGIVLNLIGAFIEVWAISGNLDAFKALTQAYWADAGIDVLTVLVSMGASILLATAVTIVTRSLSYGMAAAVGWFAVDSILVELLRVVYLLTNNDLWPKVTAYLLGAELNIMPTVVVPPIKLTDLYRGHVVSRFTPVQHIGTAPSVTYDGRHVLMVALVYGVIFAAAAIVPLWRRDVLE
jgi:ABC-2 type transport system permease protein